MLLLSDCKDAVLFLFLKMDDLIEEMRRKTCYTKKGIG